MRNGPRFKHRSAVTGTVGDALVEFYVDWREECVSVQAAYERWDDASLEEREAAFAAYHAALDREERAGNLYAELVARVTAPQPGRCE